MLYTLKVGEIPDAHWYGPYPGHVEPIKLSQTRNSSVTTGESAGMPAKVAIIGTTKPAWLPVPKVVRGLTGPRLEEGIFSPRAPHSWANQSTPLTGLALPQYWVSPGGVSVGPFPAIVPEST